AGAWIAAIRIDKLNGFGWVAQLVEQRTENPCVGGSIPPPATSFTRKYPLKMKLSQNPNLKPHEIDLLFGLKLAVSKNPACNPSLPARIVVSVGRIRPLH